MARSTLWWKDGQLYGEEVLTLWTKSLRWGGASGILRFSEILPEGWVPGGIIILTRDTKIAEMNLSEPFKNDFQFSEKSVQKKLIIFAIILLTKAIYGGLKMRSVQPSYNKNENILSSPS